MSNTMCGKNLSFTNYMEMGFIGGAYLNKRSVLSCTIAMLQPMATTLDQMKQLWKYSKKPSIGPRSLKTQENLSWLVMDVSEQGTFPKSMKCLKAAHLR